MIDGGFRENTFGAKYFSQQDFPEDNYEVIWVDYYDNPSPEVLKYSKVKVIKLNQKNTYHSSFCFNGGITEAKGEILIIADADQIVKPDFLSKVYQIHSNYDKLAMYGYRYDETKRGTIKSFSFDELEENCVQKNTVNYGACLTIRKKWLLKVNGYEQHPIFGTGFHANGTDMYTRLKNIGLAIQWEPTLRLYHPWHSYTLMPNRIYESQFKLIEWRKKNMQYLAVSGIDPSKNYILPGSVNQMLENEMKRVENGVKGEVFHILKKQIYSFKNSMIELKRALN
jgi:hypothetical protein